MKTIELSLALIMAFLPGVGAQAQSGRTIRLIVPAPIGGSIDFLGRILAQRLNAALGHHVIVDDRPGSGGIVGAELVAKAPPDGSTLLMASTAHVANPYLHAKVPYDPIDDFAPISMVAMISAVMAAHPSLPAKTVKELIAFARARPHDIDYAYEAGGSEMQLSALMFGAMARLHLTGVSYRSRAQATVDVLSGRVSLIFGNVVSIVPHIRAGRLRGLGTTGARRSADMPDLPTIAEAGLPGYEATNWFALLAPARTPGGVIDRLSSEVIAVLHPSDVKQLFRGQGADVLTSSPGQLGDHMRGELAKWRKVLTQAGAKVD